MGGLAEHVDTHSLSTIMPRSFDWYSACCLTSFTYKALTHLLETASEWCRGQPDYPSSGQRFYRLRTRSPLASDRKREDPSQRSQAKVPIRTNSQEISDPKRKRRSESYNAKEPSGKFPSHKFQANVPKRRPRSQSTRTKGSSRMLAREGSQMQRLKGK